MKFIINTIPKKGELHKMCKIYQFPSNDKMDRFIIEEQYRNYYRVYNEQKEKDLLKKQAN